jgi:hypothetical protein
MKFKEIGTECGGGALNISCGAHNRSFWAEDLGATNHAFFGNCPGESSDLIVLLTQEEGAY